jgi:DNA-binding MurR/RpiR family transcriptional regulator
MTMSKDLQQKLKDQWDTFTASEQKIASYLLQNIRELPFETADSLSKRVGVSPMTVSRFLRNLGYEGVSDLKEELRGDASWRQFYREPLAGKGGDVVSEHLQADVRALTNVHALATTKEWKSVVKLLATADRVTVASFHQGTFLGMGFAAMLQQARPGVYFNASLDGAYIDMLLESTKQSCVVLIDLRRYFKTFRTLAEEVARRKIPLVLITDTDCYWARDVTQHVLMVPADRAWHSFSAYVSLFGLLTTSMIHEKGDVMERLSEINELRNRFIGYIGPDNEKVDGVKAADKHARGRTKKR